MKKLMATVGVVALLIGSASAQDKMTSEPARMEKRGEFKHQRHLQMLEELPDLTDDQKAKIKEIHAAGKKSVEPQRKEMISLRKQLHDLKSAENPNQDEINKVIDKSSVLRAEIEKSKMASELQVRSVLTPEQRKMMDAKRKEHMEMREKKHQERRQMQDAK